MYLHQRINNACRSRDAGVRAYLNCCTTFLISALHSRQRKVPLTSSGLTSPVRVTVPAQERRLIQKAELLLGVGGGTDDADQFPDLACLEVAEMYLRGHAFKRQLKRFVSTHVVNHIVGLY